MRVAPSASGSPRAVGGCQPCAPTPPSFSMIVLRTKATLLLAASMVAGCSSVGGSAIRTGPLQLPEYSGPVAIYATSPAPPGAVDLGVVEVHAAQQEATVETLMPQFARKVAQIGGNVALIDGVRARFELVGRAHVESFYYPCGRRATCAGSRVYAANDEVMVVSVHGRAFSTLNLPAGDLPLIPSTLPPRELQPTERQAPPSTTPESRPPEGT